jgi:mono/diheme cytochrome c family protein
MWRIRSLKLLLIGIATASFLAAQNEGHGVTRAEIQRGEQIFLSNCATCHGPEGDAVSGVNFAAGQLRRAAPIRI